MSETTRESDVTTPVPWQAGQVATQRRFIPNLPVLTHRGDRRLLYDDLVRDRTVIVHFFNLADHHLYPVTRNLVAVQRLLGDRMGREVSLLSVAVDETGIELPALAEFAKRHQAGSGWHFLTGEPDDIAMIQRVFFFHNMAQPSVDGDHMADEHHADCSVGLLRYGNDAAGLWGSVPTKVDAGQIIDRLSWVQPRTASPTGRLRRGGPYLATANDIAVSNPS